MRMMGQCMRYIVEDSGAFPLLEGGCKSHIDCWNIQTHVSGFENVGLQDDNVASKDSAFHGSAKSYRLSPSHN